MTRDPRYPSGEYGKSDEYLKIASDFSRSTLSAVDERSRIGLFKSKALVEFGDGDYETVTSLDVLYILSPAVFEAEVDRLSVLDAISLNDLLRRLGRPFGRFAIHFYSEIRDRICGESNQKNMLSEKAAPASIAALSAWASTAFGISDPEAAGIAASLLFVLATTTKDSLCAMTEKEAKEVLEKRFPETDESPALREFREKIAELNAKYDEAESEI